MEGGDLEGRIAEPGEIQASDREVTYDQVASAANSVYEEMNFVIWPLVAKRLKVSLENGRKISIHLEKWVKSEGMKKEIVHIDRAYVCMEYYKGERPIIGSVERIEKAIQAADDKEKIPLSYIQEATKISGMPDLGIRPINLIMKTKGYEQKQITTENGLEMAYIPK